MNNNHIWNESPVQVRWTILDAWCTGTTQRDGMGRREGGGFRLENTCIPVADSCWYMTKPIQYCKVKKFFLKLKKKKLNKHSDNIQPWCIPFPIWNQPVVPCPILSVASWPAYRFHRRQIRWSGIPISWRIFYSLLWSTHSKALA